MRLTVELLGWTLTLAAEQAEPSAENDRGNATSYPITGPDVPGEPYEDRIGFGLRRTR